MSNIPAETMNLIKNRLDQNKTEREFYSNSSRLTIYCLKLSKSKELVFFWAAPCDPKTSIWHHIYQLNDAPSTGASDKDKYYSMLINYYSLWVASTFNDAHDPRIPTIILPDKVVPIIQNPYVTEIAIRPSVVPLDGTSHLYIKDSPEFWAPEIKNNSVIKFAKGASFNKQNIYNILFYPFQWDKSSNMIDIMRDKAYTRGHHQFIYGIFLLTRFTARENILIKQPPEVYKYL